MELFVPCDVPEKSAQTFRDNYGLITHESGKLFLFAADQKIEHLNQDFYGEDIAEDALDPQYLFSIADLSYIGAFATHLGLIARYGAYHPKINYIVKLNGKSNLIPYEAKEPISKQLWSVDNVITFKKNSGLSICGIGLTLYIGSEYEHIMLEQAAQSIFQAHQEGLVATLWVYPRGQHVDEYSPELLAGSAGLANALGADFVKVQIPRHADYDDLIVASRAAGNTKIICAGGPKADAEDLLQDVRDQMVCGSSGIAIGRNLFQRSKKDATKLAKDIAQVVYKK